MFDFRSNILVFIFVFNFSFVILAHPAGKVAHANEEEKRIHIIVGMGSRPPFLDIHGENGAGPDILNVMNQVQNHFYFKFKYIPTKRKIKMIEDGLIDLMMWDNRSWGWADNKVVSSKALVNSKDIFIALNSENIEQKYFDSLENKVLAVVRGYHYQFLDFENDLNKFSEKYEFSSVRTEEAVIKMILAKRANIGVVSETALSWFLIRYPEYKNSIIASDRIDTFYSRHFVMPEQSALSGKEINEILKLADEKGLLAPIYRHYGLTKPNF